MIFVLCYVVRYLRLVVSEWCSVEGVIRKTGSDCDAEYNGTDSGIVMSTGYKSRKTGGKALCCVGCVVIKCEDYVDSLDMMVSFEGEVC